MAPRLIQLMIMTAIPRAADISLAATSILAVLGLQYFFYFFHSHFHLTPTAYDGTIMIISLLSAATIGLDTLSP